MYCCGSKLPWPLYVSASKGEEVDLASFYCFTDADLGMQNGWWYTYLSWWIGAAEKMVLMGLKNVQCTEIENFDMGFF